MEKRKMVAEIIIICIFAAATLLAAVLAIHNISELSDTRIKYDAAKDIISSYEQQNRTLRENKAALERDLEVERTNSKMLERALLDTVTEAAEAEAEPEPEPDPNEMPLPDKPTNVISVEDCYSEAFTPDTQQHQLQCVCHTERDPKSPFLGARYYLYNGIKAYCTAISTNYTKEIGTAFEAELENGFTFYVIAADYKNPLDDPRKDWYGTPCKNHDHEEAVCIIELLSELSALDIDTAYHGTFTAQEVLGGLHGHGGNVKRLTKIGRWWEP